MNKKTVHPGWFLLLGMVFYSCLDEWKIPVFQEENPVHSHFSVQDARVFFENNATSLEPLFFSSPQKKTKSSGLPRLQLTPDWRKAKVSENRSVELIEIPLLSNSTLFTQERVYQEGVFACTKRQISARRLVIAKRRSGIIDMFVITIIPFVQTNNTVLRDLENFRYLGGGSFSGKVFCSQLDGLFVKAFGYTNGKLNGPLKVASKARLKEIGFDYGHLDYVSLSLNDAVKTRSGTYQFSESAGDPDCFICHGAGCNMCLTVDGGELDEAVIISCPGCHARIDQGEICTCPTCFWCHEKEEDCWCSVCNLCQLKTMECTCYHYPDVEEPEPDCPGEKCPDCGGIIPGTAPETRSGNCPACRCSVRVRLDAPGQATILCNYILTAHVKPAASVVSNYKFEIAGKDGGNWFLLYEGSNSSYTRKSRSSGSWQVRVTIECDGVEYMSNEETVEERFPKGRDILANAGVSTTLNNYWETTKSFASVNGRKEFGCWIYLDTGTGSFTCEDILNDKVVQCGIGTGASITPGDPKKSPAIGPLDSGYEYVAIFHTHTPLTYCTDGQRTVGPSGPDWDFANNKNVAGLVYDYLPYGDPEEIVFGHNINAAATIYSFGPDRRKTK